MMKSLRGWHPGVVQGRTLVTADFPNSGAKTPTPNNRDISAKAAEFHSCDILQADQATPNARDPKKSQRGWTFDRFLLIWGSKSSNSPRNGSKTSQTGPKQAQQAIPKPPGGVFSRPPILVWSEQPNANLCRCISVCWIWKVTPILYDWIAASQSSQMRATSAAGQLLSLIHI